MPKTNLPKLGAALCALLFALPCASAAAADAPSPAPSTGGMTFSDPDAPTVFADGSTLTAPLGGLVGETVTVSGTVAGSKPGDAIAVQRLDAVAGWITAATTAVQADGTYRATWKAARAEKTTVRAVLASAAAASTTRAASADGAAAPAEGRALTLYRRALVTWYGPGFYGRRTACGRRMSTKLVGVAHKKLPCGTLVDLYYEGRAVTVPVVDRGPFRKGTSYDLTAATARALGVTGTTTIGAVRSTPSPTPATTPATAAAR